MKMIAMVTVNNGLEMFVTGFTLIIAKAYTEPKNSTAVMIPTGIIICKRLYTYDSDSLNQPTTDNNGNVYPDQWPRL